MACVVPGRVGGSRTYRWTRPCPIRCARSPDRFETFVIGTLRGPSLVSRGRARLPTAVLGQACGAIS
eukprot:7046106-Lingulodinium_polyedra.AAC.1